MHSSWENEARERRTAAALGVSLCSYHEKCKHANTRICNANKEYKSLTSCDTNQTKPGLYHFGGSFPTPNVPEM